RLRDLVRAAPAPGKEEGAATRLRGAGAARAGRARSEGLAAARRAGGRAEPFPVGARARRPAGDAGLPLHPGLARIAGRTAGRVSGALWAGPAVHCAGPTGWGGLGRRARPGPSAAP